MENNYILQQKDTVSRKSDKNMENLIFNFCLIHYNVAILNKQSVCGLVYFTFKNVEALLWREKEASGVMLLDV